MKRNLLSGSFFEESLSENNFVNVDRDSLNNLHVDIIHLMFIINKSVDEHESIIDKQTTDIVIKNTNEFTDSLLYNDIFEFPKISRPHVFLLDRGEFEVLH